MKRMKKSSIIFLACMALLMSSFCVYASYEEQSFEFKLYLHGVDYAVSTQNRTVSSSSAKNSYLKLTDSDCPSAYTMFWVKNHVTEEVASEYLQLSNSDTNGHLIEFLDKYKTVKGYVHLMAHTSSEHSGYTIQGEWNPNVLG